MKLVGLHRRGLVDHHLDRVGDQLAFLMHIFRTGFEGSGVVERFRFDESFRYLEEAHALGRGVLHVAPHLCCYPVYPRVVSSRVPCSIYLRRSPDPRKHEINKAIGLAGNGHLVYPPAGAPRGKRLQVALQVLRDGKALFMTPDLPRGPSDGVAVRILERTVYFPKGMILMSMRTGAPIVPAVWHYEGGVYHVRCFEPLVFSSRGDRSASIKMGVRKFAELMNNFLHEHPDMWWNWLDKRWTAIIRSNGN
jgi:lauroyl/myristoyl acyltransferase